MSGDSESYLEATGIFKRRYTAEEIQRALTTVSLPDLLGRLGDAPHASEKPVWSPFHWTKRPKFQLFRSENGSWQYRCCKRCGMKGDQIDYLRLRCNLTRDEAAAKLCRLAGIE